MILRSADVENEFSNCQGTLFSPLFSEADSLFFLSCSRRFFFSATSLAELGQSWEKLSLVPVLIIAGATAGTVA